MSAILSKFSLAVSCLNCFNSYKLFLLLSSTGSRWKGCGMLAGLPEVLQRNSVDTHWIIYIDEILAIGVYMADLRTPWTKTVEKMRIQLKMLQNQPLHIKLCFFEWTNCHNTCPPRPNHSPCGLVPLVAFIPGIRLKHVGTTNTWRMSYQCQPRSNKPHFSLATNYKPIRVLEWLIIEKCGLLIQGWH